MCVGNCVSAAAAVFPVAAPLFAMLAMPMVFVMMSRAAAADAVGVDCRTCVVACGGGSGCGRGCG